VAAEKQTKNNQHIKMKKLSLFAAIALGVLACVSLAQAGRGGGGGGGGGRGGMNADTMVSNIVVAVTPAGAVSDTEKTGITKAVTDMLAARTALRGGGAAPTPEATQKVTDDYNKAMAAVLTPEQNKLFLAMPPMGRGGRGAGGKKGGGAPGAAPGA